MDPSKNSDAVPCLNWRDALYVFTRNYWIDLAKRCDFNVMRMARLSDVNRTDLYKRLHALGIELPEAKPRRRRPADTYVVSAKPQRIRKPRPQAPSFDVVALLQVHAQNASAAARSLGVKPDVVRRAAKRAGVVVLRRGRPMGQHHVQN